MPRAVDLLKQGRNEELWQMCCGFLGLNIQEFMNIQERLLLEQLDLINNCTLGKKLLRGEKPQTIEEFRQRIPLTTYTDYCPELLDKNEASLPQKPAIWTHTSGKSGEYTCKWVPMSSTFAEELSKALYGVGTISCCKGWGDTSNLPEKIKSLYSVAPVPYISGTFAELLQLQSPFEYLPPINEVESMTFEERIQLGFQLAMSKGFDYFFGLSLILVNVGDKIKDSSNKVNLKPFLKSPGALWRLSRGKIKSKLAGRPMLPRDLWKIRGIIGSGVDSIVYKDKIEKYWGRKPLDLYACTEGGVIAVQAWDYSTMTFIPQLNFLEFIPEDEQLKLQMDRTYIPKTLLLNEVKAGENYELVITNFHGGILTRYRIGDMIKIVSLGNENLGIKLPQMAFERRVDDIIDFVFVRMTEKSIWQAIENSGIPYVDWVAYKKQGEAVLQLYLELADGCTQSQSEIEQAIQSQIINIDDNDDKSLSIRNDFGKFIEFKLELTLLPKGAFSSYITQKQAEGADLAHLKPPHVNPSEKVLSMLTAEVEETIVVKKAKVKQAEENDTEKMIIT